MVEVSVVGFLGFLGKCLALGAFAALAAMFILWPINDQKTSKVQWALYGAVMLFATDVAFWGVIHWRFP